MKELKEHLHQYLNNPLDPYINASLGEEYEKIGQGAAALSYFLRASELTYDSDPLLAYNGILKTWLQLNKTKRRPKYEKGQLEMAISYLPTRPEAYLFLSKWYSDKEEWKTADMYVSLGLQYVGKEPLKYNVGYLGDWELKFQKAFVCWYVGQRDLSERIWLELFTNPYVDEHHREAVINNCINFNLIDKKPEVTTWHDLLPYNNSDHQDLRYKFPGSTSIKKNHSQCYQDMFVLTALKGKKDGTYLEIGAGHPTYGNNTLLLKEWGYRGVSLDISKDFIKKWGEERPNDVILDRDATTANYVEICDTYVQSRHVDFLQLDVDPAYNTYKTLQKIDFDKLTFGVITYEHDYYCDPTKSYKDKSRKLLESKGYILVAGNISPDKDSPYEDWWVGPNVDISHLKLDVNKRVLLASEYMVDSHIFDWGPCEVNLAFKKILTQEIITDKVYEKFFPVSEGDVVVDLGSNIGLWSYSIMDKKPKHVYALEPELECFITTEKNLKPYTNTTSINKAIASESGRKVIKGLFNKDTMVCYSNKTTSCPTISLKDFIKQYKIDKIDFLKVDCEGGEYEVFNNENYDWIIKNVNKIAGEFHFADMNDKRNFINFRELYLPKHKTNWKVLTMDLQDITHKVWDKDFVKDKDWDFLSFNLYIDNRK